MSMLTLIYCSGYTANHAEKYQLDARATDENVPAGVKRFNKRGGSCDPAYWSP